MIEEGWHSYSGRLGSRRRAWLPKIPQYYFASRTISSGHEDYLGKAVLAEAGTIGALV
jgi:hypothetical protein